MLVKRQVRDLCPKDAVRPTVNINNDWRRYRSGNGRPVDLQRDKPSDYLPLLYYDNLGISHQAVKMLRDIAGEDHLLVGSDYVFGVPPGPVAENIEAAGLPEEEVNLICCGNAQRIFLNQ